MSCAFVPAGPYSCDSGGNLQGWNKGFVSYSSFMDGMAPTIQAPFKPYFALPITEFTGSGVMANVSYHLNDNMELVYIGSYREYKSKFGQDQDATPIPVAQLDNRTEPSCIHVGSPVQFQDFWRFSRRYCSALYYLDQQGTYTARVDLNYVNPTIDFLHGPDTTPSTTKAVFGTATIHPTEKLSFTGGLRYTEDQKDYTYFRSNPDGSQVERWRVLRSGRYGLQRAELPARGHLRHYRQLQGRSHGLAPRRRLSSSAGFHGLCFGLDRVQGWRRQPATVRCRPAPAIQSGNPHHL